MRWRIPRSSVQMINHSGQMDVLVAFLWFQSAAIILWRHTILVSSRTSPGVCLANDNDETLSSDDGTVTISPEEVHCAQRFCGRQASDGRISTDLSSLADSDRHCAACALRSHAKTVDRDG